MPSEKIEAYITQTDTEGNVKSYWTNVMPKLQINTNNVKREIDVILLSVKSEDEKLLYKLLNSTKNNALNTTGQVGRTNKKQPSK